MARLSSRALAGRGGLLLVALAGLSPLVAAVSEATATGATSTGTPVVVSEGAGVLAATGARVRAALPARADGTTELREPSGAVAVGFRLAGARPVAGARVGDEARYEGALGAGTALRLRERPDGALEDLVDLESAPAQGERLDYVLDVREVAGLRKVGRVVEFLDADGAPRLRMEAPYVTGDDGRVAQADVELGCAHDESPAPPWGRAVVAPGANECRMTLSWSGVRYPAVVDPIWAPTGSLAHERGFAAHAMLPNGLALVSGGRNCVLGKCTPEQSSELFDPATGTWAMGDPLPTPHDRNQPIVLPGKGLYVISGDLGATSSTAVEFYDFTTYKWETRASIPTSRADASTAVLADGKTIGVFGGTRLQNSLQSAVTTVEFYDTVNDTWSAGGPMVQGRYWATATTLSTGKVLLAGGTICGVCGAQAKAEVYDPVAKTSAALPDMPHPHLGHATIPVTLAKGPVLMLISGGVNEVDTFDPVTQAWGSVSSVHENRAFFSLIRQSDGGIVVAGGATLPSFLGLTSVERFDPVTATWSLSSPMKEGRGLPAGELLPDGRFLVAGGIVGSITGTGSSTKTAEILTPQLLGSACVGDADCSSGHCVDSVCCDTACSGTCTGCSAVVKGQGQDGTCGSIAAGLKALDDCPVDAATPCAFTGACDGKGACLVQPQGVACGGSLCADAVNTAQRCDGKGACTQQVSTCSPYLCQDSTQCASSCATDDQCASGAHCEGFTCVGDLAAGLACERPSECLTGFCVDGVCCDTACTGTCLACAASTKESGQDGVCGVAKKGSNPGNRCPKEDVSSCDQDGTCDASGQCARYAANTPCQPPVCGGNAADGFTVAAYVCNGTGDCNAQPAASCGPDTCSNGACQGACSTDADCSAQGYCDKGTCQTKGAPGSTCSDATHCRSGFCVDGFCCQSACQGQCEACDVDNAHGFCVPVTGAAHGSRATCAASTTASAPCEARACDGIDRTACKGYVGPEVTCHTGSCTDDIEQPAALCDGLGACAERKQVRCEPFVCKGDRCGTHCASDTDCSEKFRCDLSKATGPDDGDCVARNGASCEGTSTLVKPDGTRESCAPYTCEGSACKQECTSVLDCALPSICDQASHQCVPASDNPSDGACALADGTAQRPSVAVLLALAGLARLVRRARRQGRLDRGSSLPLAVARGRVLVSAAP